MTNLTPSAAKLLATDTPCLGSETSSPNWTVIFWPRIPPAALMSAAAWSTPFFICAPVAALGPVIGPPTPNLTWAPAVPAVATAMPNATPSVVIVFIFVPLQWSFLAAAILRQGDLRRQRIGPMGSLSQRYWWIICDLRADLNPSKANAMQNILSTR